jgi:hypothetical protein
MTRGLRTWFSNKRGESRSLDSQGRKWAAIAERLERYGEVAGLAESGQTQYAQDLIREELLERPKLLLISGDEGISQPLLKYSVNFARRMGYEIVSLARSPRLADHGPASGTSAQDHLHGTGEGTPSGWEELDRLAGEAGVVVRHVWKDDPPDRWVKEAFSQFRRVMLVLADSAAGFDAGRDPVIPVYVLCKVQTV